MRMTSQRKQILGVLKKSHQPRSAEMILNQLPKKTMNLSTIYRTLDLFFDHGLISKSFMKHTTFYHINEKDHHHYMICTSCQKMYEIDCHLDLVANQVAKQNDFKITHHDMTIYGHCKSCQQKSEA
ncbi:MAG: transcriptional repressor [Acholeplasmataceae bacterium]|nr:transcriptional repressor [Acholeplasmataceae bacterium]